MPNQMVNFNVPTPYQSDMAAIHQRQRMAEMLSQQSQAPGEQFSYNGIMAKPSKAAGANKVLQAVLGAWGQKNALSEQRALGEKAQTEAMDWMSQVAAPGTPERPAVDGQAAATAADAEDRQYAIDRGMPGAGPQLAIGQPRPTSPGFGDPGSEGSAYVPPQARSRQAQLALLMQGMGNPYAAGVAQAQIAKMLAPPEFKAVGENDRPGTVQNGVWTPTPGGAPPNHYRGTSEGAQDYNILLQGDPSSPVYAAAYNRQAQPKMSLDQTNGQIVYQQPDMSAFRRPGAMGAPAADAPTTGGEQTGRPAGISFSPIPGANPGTEGERTAATLWSRLQNSQAQLNNVLRDNPEAASPPALSAIAGSINPTLGNVVTPEARQRVVAAQLDILDAALTLGTGAAYTREQLEGYRQSYFPQYGDKPGTIAEKAERLQNIVDAAQIKAGRSAATVPPPRPGAPSESPPPEALGQLKEGIPTQFGNGQVWTKSNGKAVRVK